MAIGKYINNLVNGYQKTLIIYTANQHKVFDCLDVNPSSTLDISNDLRPFL